MPSLKKHIDPSVFYSEAVQLKHLIRELDINISDRARLTRSLEDLCAYHDIELRKYHDKTIVEVTINREYAEKNNKIFNRISRVSSISFFASSLFLFFAVIEQNWSFLKDIALKLIVYLGISKALAADGTVLLGLPAKDVIMFFILSVVSIFFIIAWAIVLLSGKDDVREFAKDSIKTTAGFYLGLLTKNWG